MARKNKNKKKSPKTALELSKIGGSKVALAAYNQTGAGKHGGSDRQKNRRDRKAARLGLRSGS